MAYFQEEGTTEGTEAYSQEKGVGTYYVPRGLGWGPRQNLHSHAGSKGLTSKSWWINHIFGDEES